jgi:hypothetical protein
LPHVEPGIYALCRIRSTEASLPMPPMHGCVETYVPPYAEVAVSLTLLDTE